MTTTITIRHDGPDTKAVEIIETDGSTEFGKSTLLAGQSTAVKVWGTREIRVVEVEVAALAQVDQFK